MSKVTTKECKKELAVKFDNNPDDWKRLSKYKDDDGVVTRVFASNDGQLASVKSGHDDTSITILEEDAPVLKTGGVKFMFAICTVDDPEGDAFSGNPGGLGVYIVSDYGWRKSGGFLDYDPTDKETHLLDPMLKAAGLCECDGGVYDPIDDIPGGLTKDILRNRLLKCGFVEDKAFNACMLNPCPA